jgi:hypothetical protein
LQPTWRFSGIVFLFAPGVAEQITQITHDACLNLLYGQNIDFCRCGVDGGQRERGSQQTVAYVLILTAGTWPFSDIC